MYSRYVLVNLTVSIAKGYKWGFRPPAVSESDGKVIGSFRVRGDQSPLCVGSSLTRQIGPCNDLETEINKERARNGLGPLKCDQNMRWVANKHVENQLDNGYTDGQVRTLFHFLLLTIFISIRNSPMVAMDTLGWVALGAVSPSQVRRPGHACGINLW